MTIGEIGLNENFLRVIREEKPNEAPVYMLQTLLYVGKEPIWWAINRVNYAETAFNKRDSLIG